jgi:hypothetical protein
MGKGLKDPSPLASGSLHHASIHQEQQHSRLLVQRRLEPEIGPHQVVLQVQTSVQYGLLEESQAVFVVAMPGEVGESAFPVASQSIHE